jgi:minor curlin subunit
MALSSAACAIATLCWAGGALAQAQDLGAHRDLAPPERIQPLSLGPLATPPGSPGDGSILLSGASNYARAEQSGSANQLLLQQTGGLNVAEVYQSGSCNSANVTAIGNANRATVEQVGVGNSAEVLQAGTLLNVVVRQYGDHSRTRVFQFQ